MNLIKIIELKNIENYECELSLLLEETINGGASIGFLAPANKDEVFRYLQNTNDRIINGHSRLWIAIKDGQLIGSIQLSLTDKKNGNHRAEIEKLMVATSARKQGVATLLLNQLEVCAKEMGLHLLILDTREDDISENLYCKMKFIKVGIIPHFALSSNGNYDGTAIYYKLIDGYKYI